MAQVTKPILKDETMRKTESGVVKTAADLLAEIRDKISGSGGTTDYTALTNKPKINNVELLGNKSLSDLGLAPKSYIDEHDEGLQTNITNEATARNNADIALGEDIDKKIDLLGNESGSGDPYNFPYHISDLRYDNADNKLKGTLHTITLDNNKTIKTFPLEAVLPFNEKVNISDIINDVTHTDTNKPLSANMGKDLSDRINNLQGIGRYLSNIDCNNKLVATMPTTLPYSYRTGDYFIVTTGGGYKPKNGVSEIPAGATNIEWEATSQTTQPGDVWRYDGTNWLYEPDYTVATQFSQIGGQPSDNTNLAAALNAKQNVIDSTHKLDYSLLDNTPDLSKMVETDTVQTISGAKNFTGALTQNSDPVVTSSMLTSYRTASAQDTIDAGKQAIIGGGAANNIVAYSGTAGTLNTLTRVQSISSSNTDLEIPTAKAAYTSLSGKQATITGGASSITTSNLTVDRALVSNSSGKVAVSDITATELGYLDGVTSNVQTQLNDKGTKVTSISSSSTDAEYPSAKAVYDYITSLDADGTSY